MSGNSSERPSVWCCFVSVSQSTIGILERFGRFVTTLEPGCHCIAPPCIDSVDGWVSTRTNQLRLTIETKTHDSVFVKLIVMVQYEIQPQNAERAHYSLAQPQQQIASFVENTIRSQVADIEMDDLFTSKDDIAKAVLDAIDDRMRGYGFEILETLVTDIEPAPAVKTAMNQIVEAKRLQNAAEHRGEADKIIRIKEAEARKASTILDAEADAAAKRLAGEGMAAQREAIVNGLRESVANFAEGVGVNSQEAMQYVVLTQHYDTLKDVANGSSTSTLFLPHGPAAVSSLGDEIRNSFLQAKMVPAPESAEMTRKSKTKKSANKESL